MKYGSLNNLITANGKPAVQPAVGMGVTVLHWTDRSAGTITRLAENGKRFWMRGDKAVRTDNLGMTDAQSYVYEPQPEAAEVEVKLGRDGRWYTSGGKARGYRVAIGYRDAYYDYSF